MDNLHLIQLSGYDRPVITEEPNQDWIGIGADNNYYKMLIDAFMDSTTNNAVINGIVNQIYGKGLDATDSNRKPEQYAQMKSLLKPKDLRRVCQDLKLLGEGAFQVTYKGKEISSITHFPRETLRPEKVGEDGEIKNYLYAADWAKVKRSTVLKKFPVFGSGAKNEIYIVRRYVTGFHYISPADYQTSYAVLEKEIADYLINDTLNGFSGTKIVNFNNGVPDPEKQQIIKNQVLNKLTGATGSKVIISFNDNVESKATVDDVPLNDAPAHYSYLSEEAKKMIMLTHRVTSPLLLGLSSANGFSSNADEIINASNLFNNIVIKPYQHLITDALDDMMSVNGISLNLYFKTIEPLEFMDLDNTLDDEVIEEETGVKVEDENGEVIIDDVMVDKELDKVDASYNGAQISSAIDIIAKVQEGVLTQAQAIVFLIQFLQLPEEVARGFFTLSAEQIYAKMTEQKNGLFLNKKDELTCFAESQEKDYEVAQELIDLGEDVDPKLWEVINEIDVDYENEDFYDEIVTDLNNKALKLSKKTNLVSTGTAIPNAKSSQDEKIDDSYFKVRYYYYPKKNNGGKTNSPREFCVAMVKADKLYRKEDIVRMEQKAVNAGWGPKGSNFYSIWRFKGGGNCHHSWRRVTFRSTEAKIDVKTSKDIIGTRAAEVKGYKVRNDYEVSIQPRNLPNKGFLPSNPQGK